MKRKLAILVALSFVTTFPLIAQKKEDRRLKDSTTVLQEILTKNNGLPNNILNQAKCVLIFPSVKKVAIGLGVSYGRGALVCRQGSSMNGKWGAPAMYALDQGSIGVQLGATTTDFVLVIMNQKGADQFLNGKTIFGSNAAPLLAQQVPGQRLTTQLQWMRMF
jgi:SH3 domain-containing YSC84-like protein 1